jgi:O-antigen/teichoic acid export membrane protein
LGAVQVMPLAELASRSFRAGAATLAQVRGWAYPWRRLIAFLVPNFFGNPAYHAYFDVFEWRTVPVSANAYGQPITAIDWGIKNYVEGGAYMGLLPLMLAAIALGLWAAARRPLSVWLERRGLVPSPAHLGAEAPGRPYRAIFAVLGLASFSFVFGTPTYALLYYGLPFINQLHSPFRWVWPMTLSVCVLAAFGVEALRRGDRPEDRLAARMARWLGWGAIWGGVGVAILLVLSRAFYGQIEGLVERIFFGLALAPNAFPDARAFYSYQARQVLVFAALLACSGIVLRLSLCPIYVPRLRVGGQRIPVWEPLAVGILALDLVAASYNFHPAVDPALLDFTPPAVEFLRSDESLWRFTSYDPPGAQTMNANSGWFYDLEDVRGYDSLIPKQYADYMALIAPQGQLQYNRIAPIFTDTPQALDSPLLDLLNVRYVLSEVEIDSPKYELVYQGEVHVYENLGAMPRAFSLPLGATVIYDDEPEAFAEIARQYDLRQFVALSHADAERLEALQSAAPPQAADPAAATITAYTPNEVWIDVQVGEPSWLVLADSNSPGWRAWVRPIGAGDDQEVEQPVWTVDGNFRGVTLEPGAWTVRFKYSPDSFKLGAFASFMAGVIVIFAAGVWVWRYAYRESPSDSAVRRVAKNSLAPIVLNLFTRGIDFAFAALMLRIVQPEGAGKFYYAIVIWGWFEIITNFGLNTLLTREVARDKSQAGRYLVNTSLLRLTLVALSVPLLVGFIGLRQTIIQPPLQADTLWVIALLYVGLLPSSLSTGLTALFYAYEKAEHPASITTVSAIVKASLGAIVLLAGGGIVGVAGVSIITNLVTLGILTALALRHFLDVPALRVRPDLSAWRGMIVISFPLMLNHLLATLFFKIDVILLETTWGNAVVGWYSTAYKWLDALNIIPSFFTQAIFPVMSRQAHEDPPALLRTYRLAVKLLVMTALPVAVASTLLARQLIGLLGGAAYLPHGAIALQLMVWSIPIGWINSITNYVLIALNRQRVLTWAFVIGVAFNVTANLIFLPRYSYPAAAIITIFSELTLLVAFYIVLRSALGRVSWLGLLWRPALAATLMTGATLILARTHLLAGLGGGLAVYLAVLIVLRPLTADEAAQIAPLLPRPIRARLAPGPSTQAGG